MIFCVIPAHISLAKSIISPRGAEYQLEASAGSCGNKLGPNSYQAGGGLEGSGLPLPQLGWPACWICLGRLPHSFPTTVHTVEGRIQVFLSPLVGIRALHLVPTRFYRPNRNMS